MSSLKQKSLQRHVYAWLDHDLNFRSKVKYSQEEPDWWQYDGSSTGQTSKSDTETEVYLKPVKTYSLPKFLNGMAQVLVLCETYLSDKTTPHPDNKRHGCSLTMDMAEVKEADPWYGFELEFFIMDSNTSLPLGFPKSGEPPAQGPFYCSMGGNNCFGRKIMEEFEALCLLSGIGLVGSNAEVACGQWEYQIFGKGLIAADDAWASRFILNMVAEKHGAYISWHPKPFPECNGSGMHVNFSTCDMRTAKKGRMAIKECIRRLYGRHQDHLKVYGAHNELRLTGKHETSSMEHFSHGIGTRNTSVRINHETAKNWHGYIEDRRPASSCDMYSVVKIMAETVILQHPRSITEIESSTSLEENQDISH
jgi:glutamine synthetase